MKTLFILASVMVALVLVVPCTIKGQNKGSTAQKQVLPKFRAGTPYPTVRKELIKLGWQPVTMPTATPCGEDDTRCQGFTEVYFCSGVGQAMCTYTWKKKTKSILIVSASGEGVQTFSGLGLCSRSQTQSVPECGGAQGAEAQKKKAAGLAAKISVAQPGFYVTLFRTNCCGPVKPDSMSSFRSRGYSAFFGDPHYSASFNNIELVEVVTYGEGGWNLLFVGPFPSKSDAKRVVAQIPSILKKQITNDARYLSLNSYPRGTKFSPDETTGFYSVEVMRVLPAKPGVADQLTGVRSSNEKRTPDVIRAQEAVNEVLLKAGTLFKEGLLAYEDNRRSDAGERFNKSIEVFLYSTLNMQREPRLQNCYNQLIETIYSMEFPSGTNLPQVRNLSQTCAWNIDKALTDRVAFIAKESAVKKPGFNSQTFDPSPLDELGTLQISRNKSGVGYVRVVTAKAGDTVTKVAERYGADPAVVAKYNGLLPNSVLGAGREIKIP